MLVRPLKPRHQVDQLLLAELLQIIAIHSPMDSDFTSMFQGINTKEAGKMIYQMDLVLKLYPMETNMKDILSKDLEKERDR